MIGRRIKQARKRASLTQKELGEKIGVTPQSINQWETGVTKAISGTNLIKAAQALGTTPQWILHGSLLDPVDDELHEEPARDKVPLISWTTAGDWCETVDEFHPEDAEDWVITTANVSDHSYALRIQGDSMEPAIPNGSIIIVDPHREAKHRSIVIVRQNHDSEATCKRLIIDGGSKYLQPENQRYPIMEMRDDAAISGVVRQVVIDME